MTYDFDEVINRYNTNSLKYDFPKRYHMPDGLLPLWVADMDFAAPPEVCERLSQLVSHKIFGYSESTPAYYESVSKWFSSRFGFESDASDILLSPGVVFALATMIRAFTNPGDAVLIQTPVYYPFYAVISDNNRRIVKNSLRYDDGYHIDFEDFEQKIIQEHVKLFILCNPHNPVARVWTKDELYRLNDICVKHSVMIASDEIHCDFVWGNHTHTSFALLNEDACVLTAPSKTFNIAGLQISNLFVFNHKIRKQLKAAFRSSGYSNPNTFGLAACQSCYESGGAWLDALRQYISSNIDYTIGFINQRLPKVKVIAMEGTYLMWLDFKAYGLTNSQLNHMIIHDAKLWLDDGVIFGEEGSGFQRINIGCPRATLTDALGRLAKAF